MSTLNVDKVDPSTGTALEIGTSGDTITVPSGATFVVAGTTEITGTNNVQRPNAQPLFINGDMQVAQRGTSVTGSTTGGYTTVDRMEMQIGSLGTWTIIQEAQTSGAAFEAGFSNAFRIDCTTADASPSASDYLLLNYELEGQNVQLFKKGTSAAETYTLAFWVKSNKTGTAQVNVRDDNNRMCSPTYTISSTDTWEHKVLNIPADTTGTIDNDNGSGMLLQFWLDAGSNYTGGTAPTAWETVAATDESANNLSLGDSTSNDWAITGIQFEVGTYTSSTLPPFQFESYGNNLARCQRYFWTPKTGAAGNGSFAVGGFFSTTQGDFVCNLPCQMRGTYSVGYSALSDIRVTSHTAAYDASAIALNASAALDAICIRVTSGSTLATAGNYGYVFLKNTSAVLKIDAEL